MLVFYYYYFIFLLQFIFTPLWNITNTESEFLSYVILGCSLTTILSLLLTSISIPLTIIFVICDHLFHFLIRSLYTSTIVWPLSLLAAFVTALTYAFYVRSYYISDAELYLTQTIYSSYVALFEDGSDNL